MNRRSFLSLLAGAATYEAAKKIYVLPPIGGWRDGETIMWEKYRMAAVISLMDMIMDMINATTPQYIFPELVDWDEEGPIFVPRRRMIKMDNLLLPELV